VGAPARDAPGARCTPPREVLVSRDSRCLRLPRARRRARASSRGCAGGPRRQPCELPRRHRPAGGAAHGVHLCGQARACFRPLHRTGAPHGRRRDGGASRSRAERGGCRARHSDPPRWQLAPRFPRGDLRPGAGAAPVPTGRLQGRGRRRTSGDPYRAPGDAGHPARWVWLPRRGPITVSIGPAATPEAGGWPEMVRLRDLTRDEIARLTGEPIVHGRALTWASSARDRVTARLR
jgi:hypothetical protein